MKKKYIKITYLHAKIPFLECGIRFLIKSKQSHSEAIKSELELLPKPISQSLEETITITYSPENQDYLALHVIAVSKENRVINIGTIHLNLTHSIQDKKQYLKGITDQNGFIIYSINSIDKNTQQTSSIQKKQYSNRQAPIKFNNGESNGEENEEEIEGHAIDKDDFKKFHQNNSVQSQKQKVDQSLNAQKIHNQQRLQVVKYVKSIAKSDFISQAEMKNQSQGQIISAVKKQEEGKQFEIDLLRHKLKNSEYRNILIKNELFQVTNLSKIRSIIGKSSIK